MKFAVNISTQLEFHGFNDVSNSYVNSGNLLTETQASFLSYDVLLSMDIRFIDDNKIDRVDIMDIGITPKNEFTQEDFVKHEKIIKQKLEALKKTILRTSITKGNNKDAIFALSKKK